MFITLEGIEGSGKTTALPHLVDLMERRSHPCQVTREPGGTPFGQRLRSILGALGLPGDAALRTIGDLSGGETARVALAGLVALVGTGSGDVDQSLTGLINRLRAEPATTTTTAAPATTTTTAPIAPFTTTYNSTGGSITFCSSRLAMAAGNGTYQGTIGDVTDTRVPGDSAASMGTTTSSFISEGAPEPRRSMAAIRSRYSGGLPGWRRA